VIPQQSDPDYIPKKREVKQKEKTESKTLEVGGNIKDILSEPISDTQVLGKRSQKDSKDFSENV
jgi:hypothetical protein